jgi:predicted DNA-binding transcriptional regulator AlpA
MPTRDKQFLSAHDLARRWDVHYLTIFKWAKSGRLPKPVRLAPGTTRWRAGDIMQHEAKCRG